MRENDSFPALTRYFALLVGLAFTAAGIAGFLPAFTSHPPTDAPELIVRTSYGLLLGLFPVNILHNLFHLGLGLVGVIASRQYSSAWQFSRVLGLALTALTLMGILPALRTGFGLLPLYGHDVWLHGLEAAIGLYLGFYAGQKVQVQMEEAA